MTDSSSTTGTMGILAGGGPAPGINAVIAAATIRARVKGTPVLGFRNGFSGLMTGDPSAAIPLDIADVSRIHLRGGSTLGISRANPTRDEKALDQALESLRRHNVTRLVTIGGDDTAFSAFTLAQRSGGELAVAHVPKTIDNDLDLPPEIDTFGYQTARSEGVSIVRNLMMDARTTSRWYFVVAMGRKAGHLALGIGKAAGATLTIIPEEFEDEDVPVEKIVDILVAAIVKRRSENRPDGVAVIAEGVALAMGDANLEKLGAIERDPHGHTRLAEINLGGILKQRVRAELARLGIDMTIASKDIGYELRSADPVPADMEYCRDLGYCAAKFLLRGGRDALVTMQGGKFVPVPLGDMLDPETGRMRVRLVDIQSERYGIARRYMIRLRQDDFQKPEVIERIAETCGLSPEAFRERFGGLVEHEPPPLVI